MLAVCFLKLRIWSTLSDDVQSIKCNLKHLRLEHNHNIMTPKLAGAGKADVVASRKAGKHQVAPTRVKLLQVSQRSCRQIMETVRAVWVQDRPEAAVAPETEDLGVMELG